METNIISAIISIIKSDNYSLNTFSISSENNRANATGDKLEDYIRAAFAGILDEPDKKKRKEIYEDVFSYIGNTSNPPDMIIKYGDAIEVKKLEVKEKKSTKRKVKKENKRPEIVQFNSSYPKQTLKRSDRSICEKCKACEDNWKEKDMIYAVGFVKGANITHISLVYGSEYCASEKTYERLKTRLKTYLKKGDSTIDTSGNEIALIQDIDDMGITNLRVRPMWTHRTPESAFSYVHEMKHDPSIVFSLMCIINIDKWNTLANRDELEKLLNEDLDNKELEIKDIKVKDPDDVKKEKNAKLIVFYKYNQE